MTTFDFAHFNIHFNVCFDCFDCVGEVIHDEREGSDDEEEEGSPSTRYRLVGVVVHSGQASGGHYYSYIAQR